MKISISFAIAALYAATTATAAPWGHADHTQVQTTGDNGSGHGGESSSAIPISALNGPVNVAGHQEGSHTTTMNQKQNGSGSTTQVQKAGSGNDGGHGGVHGGLAAVNAANGPINVAGHQEGHSSSTFNQEAAGSGSKTQIQKGSGGGTDGSASGGLAGVSAANGPVNALGKQENESHSSYKQAAVGNGNKVQIQKGGPSGTNGAASGGLAGVSAANGPINAAGKQTNVHDASFDQQASGNGKIHQTQTNGHAGTDAPASGAIAASAVNGPVNALGKQESISSDNLRQAATGNGRKTQVQGGSGGPGEHNLNQAASGNGQTTQVQKGSGGTNAPADGGLVGASAVNGPVNVAGHQEGHSSSTLNQVAAGNGKTHQTQETGREGVNAPASGAIAASAVNGPVNALGHQEGTSRKSLNQIATGSGNKSQIQKAGGEGTNAPANGGLVGASAANGPVNVAGHQKGESETSMNQQTSGSFSTQQVQKSAGAGTHAPADGGLAAVSAANGPINAAGRQEGHSSTVMNQEDN
ncbi:hypothetical protein BX666DRAFT_1570141 [Dichotomocladium elegans]|nr:hypothetical protein BX666DRAFT_1570141 [Dichotomocladium elegans]